MRCTRCSDCSLSSVVDVHDDEEEGWPLLALDDAVT